MKWEILHLNARISRYEKNKITKIRERYKRIRINVEGAIGEYITDQDISDIDLFNKVMDNLRLCDVELEFTKNEYYSGSAFNDIHFPILVEDNSIILTNEIDMLLTTNEGNRVQDTIKTCSHIPDYQKYYYRYNRNSKVKNALNLSWLLTPEAIAKVLSPYLNYLVLNNTKNLDLPYCIYDPGKGYKFDLEGTVVKSIHFYRKGIFETNPFDNYTSIMSGTDSTGHRGLSGISLREIVLEPDQSIKLNHIDSSTILIIDAELIEHSQSQYVLFTTSDYHTFVCKIKDIYSILQKGLWYKNSNDTLMRIKCPWFFLYKPSEVFVLV